MPAPTFTDDEFLAALQRLMPRGPVWPRGMDAGQTKTLAGLVPVYTRGTADANQILKEAFPGTAIQLLPEWEATLGLPDPCAGAAPTIEQRQLQVLAKFIGAGSANPSYYIALAALLGYTITITEFSPFRFGDPMGKPIMGEDWAHAWMVNAPEFTITKFRFGISKFGDPFATWGNTVLQCQLEEQAQSHTILIFNYSP